MALWLQIWSTPCPCPCPKPIINSPCSKSPKPLANSPCSKAPRPFFIPPSLSWPAYRHWPFCVVALPCLSRQQIVGRQRRVGPGDDRYRSTNDGSRTKQLQIADWATTHPGLGDDGLHACANGCNLPTMNLQHATTDLGRIAHGQRRVSGKRQQVAHG